MSLYEIVYIARPDLGVDDVDALTQKFASLIVSAGGSIISSEYWGLRQLAYKIKKYNHGHYVLLNISLPEAEVSPLIRSIGYDNDVIRRSAFAVDSHHAETPMFVSKTAKESRSSERVSSESEVKSLVESFVSCINISTL